MKARVKGRLVGPWKVLEERVAGHPRLFVRRWSVDTAGKGKNERLPAGAYRHLLADRPELEGFVRRLNAEIFRREAQLEGILDRTAFLNTATLDRYRAHLDVHIPTPRKVDEMMNMLRVHVLNVFVGKFNLVNPKDWLDSEDRWYQYLLDDPTAPRAASTKKKVLQCLNRFLRWLHKIRKEEVPLMTFEGPGFHRLASTERNRNARVRTFIPDSDWKKIEAGLPADIKPWILLCYRYGLRRNEALGLTFEGVDSVFKRYLRVRKQLKSYNPRSGTRAYDKLKSQGRQAITGRKVEYRDVPHWFGINAEETCDLIEGGTLMHPTTLTKRWRKYVAGLKERGEIRASYDIHELRHTWITRAVNSGGTYDVRAIQLAAGHANIRTTMGYAHDNREADEERVRPRGKAA